MRELPRSRQWIEMARRIVWFEEPESALADSVRFVAYAMRYGTAEDMAMVVDHIGTVGLVAALDAAPPGIIDPRSWSYWNIMLGRDVVPPMPRRQF